MSKIIQFPDRATPVYDALEGVVSLMDRLLVNSIEMAFEADAPNFVYLIKIRRTPGTIDGLMDAELSDDMPEGSPV